MACQPCAHGVPMASADSAPPLFTLNDRLVYDEGMGDTPTAPRAIAYHRCSTDEQAASGLGIDAQTARTTDAIAGRGWTLVNSFADEGRSGKDLRRPELAAALDALDVDVDTTTPTGGLVANITSSVAQWERQIIAARTSEALQAKKARGARLGRPVTLPEEVRHRIAAERAAGRTLAAIAADLNSEAVPTARGGRWYPSTVRAVLASLDLDAQAAAAAQAA